MASASPTSPKVPSTDAITSKKIDISANSANEDCTKKPHPKGEALLYGAPGTIRTYDRLIRSQVLYPAELRARRVAIILLTLSFSSPKTRIIGLTANSG